MSLHRHIEDSKQGRFQIEALILLSMGSCAAMGVRPRSGVYEPASEEQRKGLQHAGESLVKGVGTRGVRGGSVDQVRRVCPAGTEANHQH
jgi:hypothetical protein